MHSLIFSEKVEGKKTVALFATCLPWLTITGQRLYRSIIIQEYVLSMEINSIIQTSRYIFMSTFPLTASKQSDLTVKTVQIRLFSLSIWLVHYRITSCEWSTETSITLIPPFHRFLTFVAFYVDGSSCLVFDWLLCSSLLDEDQSTSPNCWKKKKTFDFFSPKTLLGFVVFCNCHFNEIVLPEHNKETSCPKLPGTKPVT